MIHANARDGQKRWVLSFKHEFLTKLSAVFSKQNKNIQHTTSHQPPDPEDSPTQHRSEYTVKRSHKLIKRHNVGVDSNSTSGLEALPWAHSWAGGRERWLGKLEGHWKEGENFPHFSKSWKMFLLSLSSPLYRGSEGLTFNLENFTAKKTLKMMGFPSSVGLFKP